MPLLDLEQIDTFGNTLTWHRFEAGERVVRQGEEAHHFYIVSKGRAEVVNEYHADDPVHLAWLDPGDYFGEIGILKGEPRSATVRVPDDGEPLDVLEMNRDDFRRLMESSASTSALVAARVVERLAGLATS